MLLKDDHSIGDIEDSKVGSCPAAVERGALVQGKMIEVDAHNQISIDGLAECRVVDPSVLIEPARDFLLTNDLRSSDVVTDVRTNSLGKIPGGACVRELQLNNRPADHGHMFASQAFVFGWYILRTDQIRDGQERGTAARSDQQAADAGQQTESPARKICGEILHEITSGRDSVRQEAIGMRVRPQPHFGTPWLSLEAAAITWLVPGAFQPETGW